MKKVELVGGFCYNISLSSSDFTRTSTECRFFPTNLIVIGFEVNFEKYWFSSWVSLRVICWTEEYGMLRFCVGPHIAARYKSIGKIFAVKSLEARVIEGLLLV